MSPWTRWGRCTSTSSPSSSSVAVSRRTTSSPVLVAVEARRRRLHRRRPAAPVLPAPRSRRQRDDAQPDLRRHARPHRAPGATPAPHRRPRSSSTPPSRSSCAGCRPFIYFRRTLLRERRRRRRRDSQRQKVAMYYDPSGNRDEAVFENAATSSMWDARRTRTWRSVAGGPHFCLGASLARLEIRVHVRRDPDPPTRHAARRHGATVAVELHERHQAHARPDGRRPTSPA